MASRQQVLKKVVREVTQAFTVDELKVLAVELNEFVKARTLAESGELDADSLNTDSLLDWL